MLARTQQLKHRLPLLPQKRFAGDGRIFSSKTKRVFDSLSESLRECGYKVPSPKMVQEPCRLQRLEAIITDVVLPNMSGPEIVEKTSQARMSCMCPGHMDNFAQRIGPDTPFMQKPFNMRSCVEAEEAVEREYGVANLAIRLISKFIG